MADSTAPPEDRLTATDPPADSMRRDLLTAYAATGAKAAAWATISAVVYRADAAAFAVLALVRATIGLLNYTSLGLAPGMIRLLTRSAKDEGGSGRKDEGGRLKDEEGRLMDGAEQRSAAPTSSFIHHPSSFDSRSAAPTSSFMLHYSSFPTPSFSSYSNGTAVALLSGGCGILLVVAYAVLFRSFHRLPLGQATPVGLVLGMGLGMVLRLTSDAPAAVLQTSGRIAADNTLLVAAEVTWVVLTVIGWRLAPAAYTILDVTGAAFAVSGLVPLVLRLRLAAPLTGRVCPDWRLVTPATVRRLLAFGSMVTVAQLADFLYAPTDYVLINRLIDPSAVAVYAPAVQIDAALLLAVSGLSAVLLPKAAIAHAAGNRAAVRRYYVRGTLASLALLTPAALAVWVASPYLLRTWLGSTLPQTRAILPLVLIHTVVGGSSAVGRSILLAVGSVKPFAASVLVAGVINVMLSFAFVQVFGWGLKGIILGTIVAVVGRCAVWTPWYVLRELGRGHEL